jgi:hypothetical protein
MPNSAKTRNRAALIETGRALVRRYMADAATSIRPQAVVLPVEGVIAGVRVQGLVDLLDIEGRIIDFKTAARRPAGITPEYRLPLTTYSMITPGGASTGLCGGHRATGVPTATSRPESVSGSGRNSPGRLG